MTLTQLRSRLPADTPEMFARLVRPAAADAFADHLLGLAAAFHARLGGAASGAQVRALVGDLLRDYTECSDALRVGIQGAFGVLYEALAAGGADLPRVVAEVVATLHELRGLRAAGRDPDLGVNLADAEGPQVETAAYQGAAIAARLDAQEQGFAHRVRAGLAAAGLTQQQLAARLDVHPSAVSMMLSRKCRPQRRTVERVAEILGVSPDALWPDGFPAMTPRTPTARDLRRLPPPARAAALRAEAADAAAEYATNPALQAFAALSLEAAYLTGEDRPLKAAAVRRLPKPVRDLVLLAEAAAAADEYAANPALRAFAADRLEAGRVGGPQ